MGKTKHRHHDGRQRLPFGIDVKRLSKKKGGKRAERRKKRKKKRRNVGVPNFRNCNRKLLFCPFVFLSCFRRLP